MTKKPTHALGLRCGIAFAAFAIALTGCSSSGETDFRVRYEGNEADGGTAPVDETLYGDGDIATVLGNTGDLSRAGFPFFVGWNTEPDGSGTEYLPGDPLEIRGSDATLYALWIPETKLNAGVNGAEGDAFGETLAISGDHLIVGVNKDDDAGDLSGSAYVFRRGPDGWVQEGNKLTAGADAAAKDRFGYSVAIDGDYAIVGAIEETGDRPGSAYVFRRRTNGWVRETKLSATDDDTFSDFGVSVAIDGDYAMVGAWGDAMGTSSGSVYVFERTDSGWMQVERLVAEDGAEYDYFGVSVAIDGDQAVVGATYAGAYAYRRESAGWVRDGSKLATDLVISANDYVYTEAAISGDRIILGARNDDGDGGAYFFERSSEDWVPDGDEITIQGEGNWFGRRVAILDDYAVVGAFRDESRGSGAGAAYLLHRGTSGWEQQLKFTATDTAEGDWLGIYLALDDTHIVVGALGDDDAGSGSGSVYLWRYR